MSSDDRLLLRSTLSFAAMPALVAYGIPLLLFKPAARAPHLAGLMVGAFGSVILLACVRAFHVEGRGTLAPWDPPQRLVHTGLYGYSRNPMYVGVLLVTVGWAIAWPTGRLWGYAAVLATAFHIRVVVAEEPWLARTFGDEWFRYRDRVPRWLGRIRRR